MTVKAPRAFNREMYHDHPENVFYGTDDGYQDGSFSEFAEIKAHYENVAPERHEDIHMISVVGGLYGLNLIPLWRPTRLTIFDINPTAITYFKIIRRVFTSSRDVDHFLQRLTDGDYEVDGEREEFVRENIRLKQQRRAAARAWLDQASLRTELAICFRTLRTNETDPDRSAARDSHRTDGKRRLPYVDSRTEQPLDLCFQHHRVSLLRSRVCRSVERRPVADHFSRQRATAGSRAAEPVDQ